ncbi:MAG: LysR family transcriptional regulator [Pontibacterium sp.]
MNLNHIQLFIAVYKAKSFADVAKAQNVAPSSVSRAIAALEKDLQTRLFQRTTRTLIATQAGEAYFDRVVALVEELELAKQAVVSQSAEPFGQVRVTTSTSFGQKVIAPLMKSFCERYPKIQLDLVLADTQHDVIEDKFDVAIRHGRLTDSNLIAKKLLDVRYLLVGSPQYVQHNPPVTQPSDIVDHRLISFGYSHFNKAWRFTQPNATQTIAIQPALTMTTGMAIKASVENDVGLALLPDWMIQQELSRKQLVSLLPDWQISGTDAETSIWLVYPSKAFLPAKTRAFIDHLVEHLG